MVLILGLARRKDAGNVGRLLVVHPQASHGVVHAREDFHRDVARIVADEFLVDLENAFELSIKNLAVDVGQVEIDHRLAIDPESVLVNNFEDGARRHVARYKIAILRIPLFQKVPALALRNALRIALVARSLRNPDASAFAASRLRHEAELVFSGNGSRVDLDELPVRVVAALLIERGLRRSGAHNGVRGLAEDRANAPGRNDDRVGRESAHFHGAKIHRANSAARVIAVENGREEFPVLVLLYFVLGFVAADLFVERIEKLLTGRRTGKSCSAIQSSAKSAKVEQAFGSAIKGNAHAIEKVDDGGCSLAHSFYRRLVREEVSAVDGVV